MAISNPEVERCIEECLQCLRWCSECRDECLTMDPATMRECIRLCGECLELCRTGSIHWWAQQLSVETLSQLLPTPP